MLQRPDAPIVIAGEITLSAETRSAFLEASRDLQAGTRADEPGCLAYVFSAHSGNDDVVCVYELWENAASLDAHFQHPNYLGMRNLFGQFGRMSAVVTKYRVDAESPVYGADRIATASFW
jgi:quinol monooxygenase YgiN